MSCRRDISLTLFRTIPPRTVRIRSVVLAFVSTGYMRGCRPTPRRAAASSTAYPFAPKSPPGDFAFPVSPESGGNGWSCRLGLLAGTGWGCVMVPMVAKVPMVSGPALSDSVIQVPVTVTGITPVTLMLVMELSQFLRSRRSRASGLPPHQEYFTAGGDSFHGRRGS